MGIIAGRGHHGIYHTRAAAKASTRAAPDADRELAAAAMVAPVVMDVVEKEQALAAHVGNHLVGTQGARLPPRAAEGALVGAATLDERVDDRKTRLRREGAARYPPYDRSRAAARRGPSRARTSPHPRR